LALSKVCNQILIIPINNWPYPKVRMNFSCHGKQLPLSKSATKIRSSPRAITLVQDSEQILVALKGDCMCPRIWPKLSTLVQITIGPIRGMWLNFGWSNEQSPMSKNATKILHLCPSNYWTFQGVQLYFDEPSKQLPLSKRC
jgi:hypothetical protein